MQAERLSDRRSRRGLLWWVSQSIRPRNRHARFHDQRFAPSIVNGAPQAIAPARDVNYAVEAHVTQASGATHTHRKGRMDRVLFRIHRRRGLSTRHMSLG